MLPRDDIGVQFLDDEYNNGIIPPLKRIGFTILYKCDGSCRYCFTKNDIASGRARIEDEISPTEFGQILHSAIPLGLEEVQLSGGEPLLKSNVLEFVKIAKRLDLRVGIFTNGSQLSRSTLNELNSLELDWIRISLGGSTDAMSRISGRLRDTKERFQRIVSNIRASVETGLVTGLFTPVTKNNYRDIGNTAKLAKDLGVRYIIFCNYIPQGNEQDKVNQMSIKQHYHAIETLLKAREQQRGFLDIYAYYGFFEYLSPNWNKSDFVAKGPCGRERLSIISNGDVRTCLCTTCRLDSFRRSDFNLRKLWEEHPLLFRIRNSSNHEPCPQCQKREVCQPCLTAALNLNKRIDVAPPQCPAVREYNLLKEVVSESDAAKESLRGNQHVKQPRVS